MKSAYGPCNNNFHPVRSADGNTLHTEKSEVLACWANHYRDLLNRNTKTDITIINKIPELPTIWDLDTQPTYDEVRKSIDSLKNNKASGPDGLPAEILKYGGTAVRNAIYSIITASWDNKCVPQQWKYADITSIYKKKGDILCVVTAEGYPCSLQLVKF